MKSKLLLSILVVFAVTASIFAKDITMSKAEQVAVNFLFQKSNQYGVGINYHDINISESYLVDQAYYVVNFENGWVLVSANDAMVPVIGYNLTGDFPAINNQLESFHNWMQSYVDQVDYIRANSIEANNSVANDWKTYSTSNYTLLNLKSDRDVDPLLTSTWNQDNPYNAMCPEDDQGPGGCVYVGCVATAMSAIMHYWRFPLTGEGSNSYYYYPYGTISANFANAEYNWNGMTDNIDNKYVWEIAEIGFHAGVSVDMMYGWDGSGAYSQDVPNALRNHFRYQNNVQYLSKSSYTTSAWENMMQGELDNSRPIYYSGRSSDGGHAFVCDAYQGMNYYHFNFGWSGSGNGYFSLQDVGGFNQQQAMIRNIYPGDSDYPYIATGLTELSTLIGSFTDGSGPAEDYPAGMNASWLISPQNEEDSVTNITLSFVQFSTASSDVLRVYDGGDASAELLGEFSGDEIPQNIESTGNELFLTFSSTGTGSGFKIEYESDIPSWCTSQAHNDAEGTVTDGSMGFFYNNSTTCILTFGHPEATKYYIDFTEFSTEPIKDKVKIYDGVTGTLLGEFSGNEIPDPIAVETSSLMLLWSTNAYFREAGWSFDYHVDGVGTIENSVENLSIFPNPTTGLLNIRFNAEKQGDMQVKLMNVNGQVILNEIITNNSGDYSQSFDISNQAKGVYLLSIISDSKKIDRKIVLK